MIEYSLLLLDVPAVTCKKVQTVAGRWRFERNLPHTIVSLLPFLMSRMWPSVIVAKRSIRNLSAEAVHSRSHSLGTSQHLEKGPAPMSSALGPVLTG